VKPFTQAAAFLVSRRRALMFRSKGTIIAKGLKIKGSVSAEGLVEVSGHIEGDVHCTSLFVSPKAIVNGGIEADRVVVNGRVEGPIRGSEVVLKSHAHVVGDIQHKHLSIERGAYFEGRSIGSPPTNLQRAPEKFSARLRRETESKATREPRDASAA
jgi:cytoskeletal protein CcmA (bactofilin family)